jgi:hypothetical protein
MLSVNKDLFMKCVRCILVLLAVLSAAGAGRAEQFPGIDFRGALYKTLFYTMNDPASLPAGDLPEPLQARIRKFEQRARAFHSRLPEATLADPTEEARIEKVRKMEKAIVSLIEGEGIETTAADYASHAVIAYEWEGMSDGPLAEAAYAEAFLGKHPKTPLAPYLNLFLAHRYRCAFECLNSERKSEAADEARRKYGTFMAAARKDPDLLVRLIAEDMEKQPYLYLENAPHPSSRGKESGRLQGPSGKAFESPSQPASSNPPIADGCPTGKARGTSTCGKCSAFSGHLPKAGGCEIGNADSAFKRMRLRYAQRAWSPAQTFMWSQPRLGGEFFLKIYMDGAIVAGRLGP